MPLSSAHLPADTYSVSALAGEVKEVLRLAYSQVWVVGEVQRLSSSSAGHLYFDLIEKGPDDSIVGLLSAVVWAGDRRRIQRALGGEEILAQGREIRCCAGFDFYVPRGRTQLIVRDVDPVYSLGLLAQRRRELIAELGQLGLLETNRRRPLSLIPLRVGLVTSIDSAAYHDFMSTLAESGYAFQVTVAPAAVQGTVAEKEISSAIRVLSLVQGLDCIAVIRGGGSRADLAAFDTAGVARAIAECPLPVLTGVGHEIDESVADLVAHTALRTPTGVAERLTQQVAAADGRVAELGRSLRRSGERTIDLLQRRLERIERGLRASAIGLERRGQHLVRLRERLSVAARTRIEGAARRRRKAAGRLVRVGPERVATARFETHLQTRRLRDLSSARMREAQHRLDGLGRLTRELSPERVLERGFSMTRDSRGRLVRSADQARPGDTLRTQLANGELLSRVEEQQLELLS